MIDKEQDHIANILKSGKMEVFSEIVSFYQDKLYHIAYNIVYSKEDAKDIVQESFIQILSKIQQWKGKNFSAWLYHIVRNKAIDHLRKKKKPERQEKHTIDFYKGIFDKERSQIIQTSLKKLSQNQRDIVYMRFFDGLAIKEIAKRKQCADGTVKATLFQVLQKLKQELPLAKLLE